MSKGFPYMKKFPKQRYLNPGFPAVYTLKTDFKQIFPDWEGVDPTDTWMEAKNVIRQKERKREVWMTVPFPDVPKLVENQYELEIEILSTTKRGFTLKATGQSIEEVNNSFWPLVSLLYTFTFSPKLVGKPMLVV